MPPVRTMPVKPVRTERTHEENQERAYIAASRRSDRSLEARVESARRASEIHKKRTGRSLRVREEDVMNEEMYEEEDDDLPMQFRRINALNPGFAFNNPAFTDRVNNYLAGQIGVRNYLHQAIFQANQNSYANHFLNPLMQQNLRNGTMQPQAMNDTAAPQWSMNAQQSSHNRSASVTTPQGNPQPQCSVEARRTATPAPSSVQRTALSLTDGPKSRTVSPTASHKRSTGESKPPKSSFSPPETDTASPTSPSVLYDQAMASQMYPFTSKLPVEAQQLIDGQQQNFNVHSYQMTSGIPMPSMGAHSYNVTGKLTMKRESSGQQTGLDQTLTPYPNQGDVPDPQSAQSAPGNLDFNFNSNGMWDDFSEFNDTKYAFDTEFGHSNRSGHITPATGDPSWNPDDFFNYSGTSQD